MLKPLRLLVPLAALVLLTLPSVASAGHTTDPRSRNLVPMGHSPWTTKFSEDFNYNNDSTISDIAFWRNYAIQGSYSGFRFVDISNPNNPVTVSETTCGSAAPFSGTGDTNGQGDITISPDGNILVRSQDSGRILPGNDLSQACTPGTGGSTSQGFEGLQIFNVANKNAPGTFVKAVFTDFGSHTHTQYYDQANNRLVIYVSRSGTTGPTGGYGTPSTSPYGGQNWPAGVGCITAVTVPLANPAGAEVANRCIPAGTGGCHDVSVAEGQKLLYGACRPNMILWDITDPINPRQLHDHQYPGITGWHSAAVSYDGRYLYAGWEPGGGTAPRCQATGSPLSNPPATGNVQTDAMKTIFVFRASDGALVGRWVLPQEQSSEENCTIHNYNIAPFADRHILVGDGYQAGNFVVDFTDPANPQQIAWSDPPCYDANPGLQGCQAAAATGGDADPGEWSTHWYNDLIVASDIFEGINIWGVTEPWWATHSVTLPFLNPQTQTEQLTCRATATGSFRARRAGTLRVSTSVNGSQVAGLNVRVTGAGVNRLLQTNAQGTASVRVRPSRRGVIRVNVDELNIAGSCSASRRVAAAPRRAGAVRGAGTGGTGGAGLTGRPI
jgi:hypothetical protein